MEETQWLDEREMKAWQGFLASSALVMREVEQQLGQEGLSHTRYEVLVRLAAAPDGSLRMTELAESLFTSKSGLSYQIAQMEKAGLVERRSCSDDVRGVLAVLTESGRRRLAEVAPGHVATVRRTLIDVLTAEQRDTIAEALTSVADRLD